jgi:hypothetical protein
MDQADSGFIDGGGGNMNVVDAVIGRDGGKPVQI